MQLSISLYLSVLNFLYNILPFGTDDFILSISIFLLNIKSYELLLVALTSDIYNLVHFYLF